MLTGDVETVDDIPVPEKNLLSNLVNLEEKNIASPSEEDNQLRKEVELEKIGNLAKRSRYSGFSKSEDLPIEGIFFVNIRCVQIIIFYRGSMIVSKLRSYT